jgi:hypothetical protein
MHTKFFYENLKRPLVGHRPISDDNININSSHANTQDVRM